MRLCVATGLLALAVSGCAWAPPSAPMMPLDVTFAAVENPVFIPVRDRDAAWEQIIDVVEDYFQIEHEQRVRLIGDVLTEGRIDTHPRVGSTIFEPWRRDSASRYERLHATLQTIRRRAVLEVRPTEGGFLVDVAVDKELEDLQRSEFATTGAAQLRHDTSIQRLTAQVAGPPVRLGWIPLGRDVALEQRIAAQLQNRFMALPPGYPMPVRLPPVEF